MLAVSMLAILFCLGVGIDVGHLAVVADQVQNAADIAATAAARQQVMPSPDDLGSTPRASALKVLDDNYIGKTVVEDANLTLLEFGNYDRLSGNFIANLAPINAVRSRVEYLAQNLVFSGLGKPTSRVMREAVHGLL
jgi:uncharacterized membrane protein